MDCSEHTWPNVRFAGAMMMKGPGGAIRLVYVGRTSLTVIGSATGRRYIFDRPGARLGVDPRDAASMSGIRVLRRADADGDAIESLC